MRNNNGLPIYVVYDKTTTDYPGRYVIRKFINDTPDPAPLAVSESLDEALKMLPAGLVKVDRMPYDEPVILETWL